MTVLVALAAIIVVAAILFGGFVAACRSIRRTDRWGTLRPEALRPQRHHLLAYAARWDDNTPALV